jgi:hypothetical protein
MFKKILLTLLALVNVSSSQKNLRTEFDINKFTGKWLQMSSDYYIQSIEEVDWKCVTTEVTEEKPYVVVIAKTPLIHHTYKAVNQSVIRYGVKNNLLISGDNHLLIKGIGPVVNNKYDYVILTKNDNLTQFVWARDYYRYQDYENDVSDQLTSWNYINKYKKPLSSYDATCLI